MNASEKLRELEPELTWQATGRPHRWGYWGKPSSEICALIDALPQLVAVVEQAETDAIGGQLPHLAAALAELEKALS